MAALIFASLSGELLPAEPHRGFSCGCGLVDPGQDAGGPVVLGLQAGLFGLPGPAELAEERLGLLGVLGPDGPVAGVVGGLRAAGGVTHADEGLVGGRVAGEPEAEGPGRVGEPAVVRGAEVQDAGALGEQAEDLPVAALDLRRGGLGGIELGVDVGEEVSSARGRRGRRA